MQEQAAEVPETVEEPVQPVLGASCKVKDSQTVGHGVYLTREQVDKWANKVLMEEVPGYEPDNDNSCAELWWNMKTEGMAKMCGTFEETGLFLALC
jgi:Kyakuja-Dileera-Zisupton transposase